MHGFDSWVSCFRIALVASKNQNVFQLSFFTIAYMYMIDLLNV